VDDEDRKERMQGLAAKGCYQAAAARKLGISRQRVGQLSADWGIIWSKDGRGHAKLTHKVCPRCGIDKPRSSYYERKTGEIFWVCKQCGNERNSEWQGRRRRCPSSE